MVADARLPRSPSGNGSHAARAVAAQFQQRAVRELHAHAPVRVRGERRERARIIGALLDDIRGEHGPRVGVLRPRGGVRVSGRAAPKETPETASVCDLGGSGSDAGVAAAARSAATRAAAPRHALRARADAVVRVGTPAFFAPATGPGWPRTRRPRAPPGTRPHARRRDARGHGVDGVHPRRRRAGRRPGRTRRLAASGSQRVPADVQHGDHLHPRARGARAGTVGSPGASAGAAASSSGRARAPPSAGGGLSAPPALLDPPRASGCPPPPRAAPQGSCSSPSSTHGPCDRPTPRGGAVAETGSV